MDIVALILGLSMIGIGFLVKSAPNLIAGYNTMSKTQKENVDIVNLTIFLRNGFIIIGLMIIGGYFFFKWMGLAMIANSMTLIVTLVGVTIMVTMAQRFDHNKTKHSKLIYFILGPVILFVIGLLTYGSMPSKTIIENDSIKFSGMYGFEIKMTDVAHVELIAEMPSIKMKTNGFSFGSIKKGYFKLDQVGDCRLLIHSELPPFLMISKYNGEKVMINFNDSIETENLYAKINLLKNRED